MLTLVIGGAASGKSEFAESLVQEIPSRSRIYLATMEPFDRECVRRIDRHRQMRAGKGFETVECYRDLDRASVPEGSTVLLECMSNLCANEYFSGRGMAARAHIMEGIYSLLARCGHLIVVSNEVFSGGTAYQGDTLAYLECLGGLNCDLAARADRVYEVVCGLPVCHKGERP